MEITIVRTNLMSDKNYSPYCGDNYSDCSNPRTFWKHDQFQCPECGWRSKFPEDFIERYKQRWNLDTGLAIDKTSLKN